MMYLQLTKARKLESVPILNELDQQSALLLAKVNTNLRKSFGGFSSFQRIAEGRRDYDLITEEVLC